MNNAEESAMDALVDEVMNAREDAASAGTVVDSAPVAEPQAEPDVDVDSETNAKAEGLSLGFADGSSPEEPDASLDEASDEPLSGDELATLRAERDGFLADSQRLAADFANYRKQSEKRVSDAASAQSAGLVRDLIPVLDACDAALLQDPDSAVGPIRNQLITELEKNGLELLAPGDDDAFDPEQHEAVMHEAAPADSEHDGPIIGEVLRAGYLWKGRVVRPAMVKVVG